VDCVGGQLASATAYLGVGGVNIGIHGELRFVVVDGGQREAVAQPRRFSGRGGSLMGAPTRIARQRGGTRIARRVGRRRPLGPRSWAAPEGVASRVGRRPRDPRTGGGERVARCRRESGLSPGRRGAWSGSGAAGAANPHADDRIGREGGSGDVEAKMMNVHVTLLSWRRWSAAPVLCICGPPSNEFRPSLDLPSISGRHGSRPNPEVIAP
jgi:hypothetical protein